MGKFLPIIQPNTSATSTCGPIRRSSYTASHVSSRTWTRTTTAAKVVKHGIVKELVIFQKGYLKYLTDNYRLNYTEDISLQDIRNFVPDVISLLGAPEKLISFPQIGYFDIKGPAGNIKTIVTPLKSEADYFGDVKKNHA